MPQPILLIAPESLSIAVSTALRRDFDARVEIAPNRRMGLASLRRGEYALVVLEEAIAQSDTETTEMIYQYAAAAPVLEINFVIAGVPRIVRQVRSALSRRAHDQARAREAAATQLKSELNASLAGLLLESELALREATPQQAPKLKHVLELASDLRNRLRV